MLVTSKNTPPPSPLNLRYSICNPQYHSSNSNCNSDIILSWVTQLAYLASQHHTSDYNRFKFGHNGSSAIYVPLSVQLPALVKDLQNRQAQNEKKMSWWLSDLSTLSSTQPVRSLKASESQPSFHELPFNSNSSPKSDGVPTLVVSPLTDLQQEISAAISSQISFPSLNQVKTSDSHPINISVIIPSTLVSIISSRLVLAPPPSPIIFHLHPSYTLDKLILFNGNTNNGVSDGLNKNLPMLSSLTVPSQDIGEDRSEIFTIHTTEEAHISASRITPLHQHYVTNHQPQPNPFPVEGDAIYDYSVPRDINIDDRRSMFAPKRFIRIRPRSDRNTYSTPILPFKPLLSRSYRLEGKTLNIDSTSNRVKAVMPPPSIPSFFAGPLSAGGSVISNRQTDWYDNTFFEQTDSVISAASTRTFGNLFLSSCPGKKGTTSVTPMYDESDFNNFTVRLSGPVKGRGAICRDLRQDLNRIKDLGIRCIVCCLDDEELDFLGVSWSHYSNITKELGLDVLRLPTPEGLAPLTPASLDTHLTSLIEKYTLRGIPILSHCRGGVGRAGLIACCWILKLGLCGWKQQEYCRAAMYDGEICPATVKLVERVISAIRRRRSLKAVETYEQVKFLVDYVEYLDSLGRPHAACRNHTAR